MFNQLIWQLSAKKGKAIDSQYSLCYDFIVLLSDNKKLLEVRHKEGSQDEAD